MKILSALLFVVFWPLAAWAGQLQFQRQYVADDVVLSYQWTDAKRQTQQLVFRLPQKDVAFANAEFQPFDNDAAAAYVIDAVQKYAAQQKRGRQEVEIKPMMKGFQVIYRNLSPLRRQQVGEGLAKIQQEAMDDYVRQHYYMSYGDYVMPDHRHIAQRYARAMQPIAAEVRRQMRRQPARTVVNYLLNWLQSIPYDQLLDRHSSNGAGFQTPYGLLLNNRGDCDTKSVALAALLRELYPRQRLVIVYVPEHAFVGLQMTPADGDYSLTLAGSSFVLLDPTGPRQLLLGEVDKKVQPYLKNGHYSYQEVPF